MKKLLKIAALVVGVILLVLLLTPVLFEKQFKDLIRKTMNDNFNAQVAFADIDLSLFRNFPDATLGIEDLSVINKAPFEGDTLVFSQEVILEMSVMELFRDSGDPLKIDALKLNQTLLNIKVDSLGNNNYDIAIKDTVPKKASGGGFRFDMEHYEINNSRIYYSDEGANIELLLEELNHEGTGDLSAQESTLSTFSSALVTLELDETNYLSRNKVQLEADIKMDLENQKYTFLENEALVNQLPLTFDGYVQVNEDNNEVKIDFRTPTSSFKNFLAVIPEEYAKNIDEVETSGDFVVNGSVNGIVDEKHIPTMDIQIASENASFKYPDLPKAVQDITIATQIINKTGLPEDTYVAIDTLNFRIDEDRFKANGRIRNLTGNMLINMMINGTINLANLEKAYPLDLEQDLNGLVTADLSAQFDMNAIENEHYQSVQSDGTVTIKDFSYTSPEIPNEIELETAQMNFNSGAVALKNFVATTGQTDLKVNGTIQNLMGYLFTDQKLKGNFQATSSTFSVNDFMVKQTPLEETPGETAPEDTGAEAIKIPSFLDVQLDFTAQQVLYDNLVLKNTAGNLQISDETARLNNVTAQIFNGNISLNGEVSTAQVPDFQMNLDLNSIDIASAFRDMELLRNLAPIAQALQGNLSTSIDLRGLLNEDLTPKLQTLAGNALAEILGARVNPAETELLTQLDQRLHFVDLNNLKLSDLRTQLNFDDGQVHVQPFDFEVKGIQGTASGSHGFDMDMDYEVALKIPAAFLGDRLGSVLSSLSTTEQDSMTVALPIGITGTYTNPEIDVNVDQAVSNLTQDIIAAQRDELKEKGKGVLRDILTGATEKDSTSTGSQKQKDSVIRKEDQIKETARDILGGILGGRKKKKDTTDQ